MRDRVRRRVLVAGRVQGVFFRQSLMDEARVREVRGWVRNLLDGRVEALLEGPEEAVAAVLSWCHEGPPMAHVDAVRSFEEPAGDEPAGFRVLPTARAAGV